MDKELRKDIPDAERNDMTLLDFWELDKDDLKEALAAVHFTLRGKLKRLYKRRHASGWSTK